MEPIDAAYQLFLKLREEVQEYQETIYTEQDTRIKVVDRMLIEVLGWPLADIQTEEAVGHGFLDYRLSIDGRGRVVVEAKRDGRELGMEGRAAGRAFRLDGAVFSSEASKEGINQAVVYCGRKNVELACVTNGREWIIFRGSRLGDGRETTEGSAFVFPGWDAVDKRFALYYDLLARERVRTTAFRPLFQEAEGRPIRTSSFRRSIRATGTARLLPGGPMAAEIDRIMSSFFGTISGDADPELLAKCFVTTRESRYAEEQLARVSADTLQRIRDLKTDDAEELARLIERAMRSRRKEFVVLVGTKGAGKSTFIDRFFELVLDDVIRKQCVIARVDVADSAGDLKELTAWLDESLIAIFEDSLFDQGAPSFEELQGLFFDDYRRLSKGALRPLYQSDKTAFHVKFGEHVETRRQERPHEYLMRLVRHIGSVRKLLPTLIFDNTDHFEIGFQERVYQYARSIYEAELALIIVPITDRTSWQMSRQGALQSFDHEALFLPTPDIRTVVSKRIEYIESIVQEEKSATDYMFGRGISLDIQNMQAFAVCLQRVLLETPEIARIIGNLANRDVRRSLKLSRSIMTSPYLTVSDLLATYVGGSAMAVPPYRIKAAITKGRYDSFSSDHNEFSHNVFDLVQDPEASPLLGLRMLQVLRDAPRTTDNDGFLTLDQIIAYFQSMHVADIAVLPYLESLLVRGLCQTFDPTMTSTQAANQMKLSPAGLQHLVWARRPDWDYMLTMAEVTPILDEGTFEDLQYEFKRPRAPSWQDRLTVFSRYLLARDAEYVFVPDHEAFKSQARLARGLRRLAEERLSRETCQATSASTSDSRAASSKSR